MIGLGISAFLDTIRAELRENKMRKSYLFDVTLTTTIRVNANDLPTAAAKVRALFAEHEAHLGMIDGDSVVASLNVVGDLDLVEIEGRAI
jgi:hypothetical protein